MDKHISIYLYNETILKTKRKELIHIILTDTYNNINISQNQYAEGKKLSINDIYCMIHLYKTRKSKVIYNDRVRSVVAWRQGQEEERLEKVQKNKLVCNENVYYLDYDDGFTGIYMSKMNQVVHFKYVQFIIL